MEKNRDYISGSWIKQGRRLDVCTDEAEKVTCESLKFRDALFYVGCSAAAGEEA